MAIHLEDLGKIESPIRCSGKKGETLYLDALYYSSGLPIQYTFKGNVSHANKTLSSYAIALENGEQQMVHFDAMHTGVQEKLILLGFKTIWDVFNYKHYTDIQFYNALIKKQNIENEMPEYHQLWKACGTLLAFGPGYYAFHDEEGMPSPAFNIPELMWTVRMVIFNLAGISENLPLLFANKQCFHQFLETFYLDLKTITEITSNSKALRAECIHRNNGTPLVLWLEIAPTNM